MFLLPTFTSALISLKPPSFFTHHLNLLSRTVGRTEDRPSANLWTFKCSLWQKTSIWWSAWCLVWSASQSFMCLAFICSLSLCYPIIPQVQSEMLKKWKRWKLGKDIDDEYRHTHSHTPHIKSGSIATGNLPYHHDNNASDPSGDSPHLDRADRRPSSSAPPEENRRLVVSYSNGTGKGRPTKSRHTLQFSFLPHKSAASRVSTATEDVCLEEKAQRRSNTLGGEGANVWGQPALWKIAPIVFTVVSDMWLSCANKTAQVGRGWESVPRRSEFSPQHNDAEHTVLNRPAAN